MSKVILSMKNVTKSYQTSGSEKLMVLDSIDLTIFAGDLVGLTAPSGAGKSTLLHVQQFAVSILYQQNYVGKIF